MTNGGGVHPLDADLWKRVASEANECAEFRQGASHLNEITVDLCSADMAVRLAFEAGRIRTGPAEGPATVSFSAPDWMTLMTGKTSLVEATNPYFGSVAVKGEPLAIAWLIPSMGALFRIAAQVWAGGGTAAERSL